MNGEWWIKEAVEAYLKALSWHSPEETDKTGEKVSLADNTAKIRKGNYQT